MSAKKFFVSGQRFFTKNVLRSLALIALLISAVHHSNAQNSSFSININGSVPPGFAAAVQKAADRWATHLQISVPVKVNVFTINSSFIPFSGLTLANGRKNFANAPVSNFSYVSSLANQLAGIETNPGEYDMDIYINLASGFYMRSGLPPNDSLDLISIVMHEMGHGLGFYSSGYVDGNGLGSYGNIPPSAIFPLSTSFPWSGQQNVATIFDHYVKRKSGALLYTCAAQNSSPLGDSITTGQFYFDGPTYVNASHGNTPVRVSGGSGTFGLGTDLLHLHDSNPKATLMAYTWGNGDTVRAPASYELAILREIGWNRGSVGISKIQMNDLKISVYPVPASTDLIVTHVTGKWKLMNSVGEIVMESNEEMTTPFTLNVSTLTTGLYCLVATANSGQLQTVKVVVSH